MSRGLSASVISALSSNTVRPIIFAQLDFSSGTLYVHDGIGTYTWGSQDWSGVGSFGAISNIQEGAEVSPYSITLTLSGVDTGLTGTALTEDYFMRDVKIYVGMLDEDDVLVDTPAQIWSGFMDVMTVTLGSSGGDSIELTCESELAKFDRSANLRYTHVQQQKRNSSDLFFEFLKDIDGAKIRWKSPSSENLTGGGGGDDLNIQIPTYER
jgi:hypothetical protein